LRYHFRTQRKEGVEETVVTKGRLIVMKQYTNHSLANQNPRGVSIENRLRECFALDIENLGGCTHKIGVFVVLLMTYGVLTDVECTA